MKLTLTLAGLMLLTGCRTPPHPGEIRFLIESSPNNLDLRQGTDAQSERIGALVYDGLARRDAHFQLQPSLARSWQRPDPLTWIFHLQPGVRFHDGHPLTAADVAFSIRSLTDGSLVTSKGGSFTSIDHLETPDPLTVLVHTRTPDASLLFNLSEGLFGVVEAGATRDEGLHPVGTGPFRFVSQLQDKDVILDRNPIYWNGPPSLGRIRFEVSPDNLTTALELRKGAADAESNAITLDEVAALARQRSVEVSTSPGADIFYLNFNTREPALADPRIREAIAFALDKPALIQALWRGQATPAETLLPPSHPDAATAAELPHYPHDPTRAAHLLDSAGLHPDAYGIRLHLTLKTSTDETTRLVAESLQQQFRAAGIDLSLRPAEFGTFYADVTRGAFQLYILRWTGSNQDPDILRYAYSSGSVPPHGGNRGRYTNPAFDRLLTAANAETDPTRRRALLVQAQQILARDLPGIPLWFPASIVVHSPRLSGFTPDPGGSFRFLAQARLTTR